MQTSGVKKLSVSVIIPTYNRAAFIAAAIQSALNQTRPPDEIVVVDDGSSDDTAEILAQFDRPVISVRRKNGGEAAARNTGLQTATGDAVIFLDSDDELMPHCIETTVNVLEEHSDVGVVYTDAHLIDSDNNHLDLYSRAMPGKRPSGMVLGELARRNFLLVTSMVRRSSMGYTNFDEGMPCAADYDFWRKIAVQTRFYYVDEPLMCYRFHESMTVATRLADTLVAEAEVQRRIMGMSEFKNLSRSEQSRAFCIHGIKQAMLGATSVARKFFRQSIAKSPTYPAGYALLFLSLFGQRTLQFAILKRRALAGSRLGTKGGPIELLRQHHEARRDVSHADQAVPATHIQKSRRPVHDRSLSG